jgi:asparagine synthase (glutamine-hydrolysing)
MSPLEVASGEPFGGGPPLDLEGELRLDPQHALEAATIAALVHSPCRVAFSGGLDSSLVLAAATAAARREGLPLPVPVTMRFPSVPSSEEGDWQETVIRYLALPEWERLTVSDELDLLGPLARRVLTTHGPYWPANAHVLAFLLQSASGGALMTGEGGDDLFLWWRWWRAADVLAGRVPRRPRDGLTLALAGAPAPVRRRIATARGPGTPLAWMTPAGEAARRRASAHELEVPWRWDRQLAWMASRRGVTVALDTYATLAAESGSYFRAPLLDQTFLASLARAGGRTGFGDRRMMLSRCFSSLLPPEILSRRGKATFNGAFFGPAALAFARDWPAEGVDPVIDRNLVDPAALREAWLWPRGDVRTADLLHRCWLSTLSAGTLTAHGRI